MNFSLLDINIIPNITFFIFVSVMFIINILFLTFNSEYDFKKTNKIYYLFILFFII